MKEYALYKGDDFIMVGTLEQIAEHLNIKRSSASFYNSPAYKRRIEGKSNRVVVIQC